MKSAFARKRWQPAEAWKALLIRDYAHIDMRLTSDGTPYIIEVNPNPWLDKSAEFAMAARKSRPELSYGDLIERIVELAMAREMWSAK
jgi:D-alanine-D-alanine ligase